jgi:hypothetical protein
MGACHTVVNKFLAEDGKRTEGIKGGLDQSQRTCT